MAYDIFRRQQVARDWSVSMGADPRAEAIAKWQASIDRQIAEIKSKYENTDPTAGVLYIDVDKRWKIASEFAKNFGEIGWFSKVFNNITDSDVKKAQYNAVDLLELRAQLHQMPPETIVSHELRDKSIAAMTAQLTWLSNAVTPVIQRSKDIRDTIEKIEKAAADAPSLTLQYLLDQLRRALSLPSWFVPAVATVTVVGVGYWAYKTFLSPITHVTRKVTA